MSPLTRIARAFDAPLPPIVTRSGRVVSCAGQTVKVEGLCGIAGIGASVLVDERIRVEPNANDQIAVAVDERRNGRGG
jgi:hypothetical protein